MGTIADELATIPFLGGPASRELRASAALWDQVSLAVGEALWDHGAAVDELGVVVVGELSAEIDGIEVGRVLPGEVCGEASAFFEGNVRSATLRATRPTQVLTLATAALRTLRWQRSRVYGALLDQALVLLVRRIRATDQHIAQVVQGGLPAPARAEPSVLVRLWKSFRPGGPSGPCPPIEPLLRQQPGLREAEGEVIAALTQSFVAEPAEEGRIVFLEGEHGAASYLVADGQVDVLRHVRGDRAELLATLRPGHQFGVNTLVEKGSRTASCVAGTAGWVYRMDASAFVRLGGDTRMIWRESVLASLTSQIRSANASLQRALKAQGGAKASPGAGRDSFQDLLRASGYLEGLPAKEEELARLKVIVTDDDIRNPKRRR